MTADLPAGSLVAAPVTAAGADWAAGEPVDIPSAPGLDIRTALGRAHHDRFRDQVGSGPTWDELDERTRGFWRARFEHLVPAVEQLMIEAVAWATIAASQGRPS